MALKQVSKDEFYKAVGGLNVHPNALPDRCDWETLGGARRLVGRTFPGYRCAGLVPTTYLLAVEEA